MLSRCAAAADELTQHNNCRDLEQTLEQVVTAAVAAIPGVDQGSISMSADGRIETRHPTSDVIAVLDARQSELHEGPCIEAVVDPPEDGIVLAQELAGADAARWPRFAPLVVEAGYRALLSTQLSVEGGVRAALNLYSATPHGYDADARLVAGLFGSQAAVLLHGTNQAMHLQRAVDSRDLIGQAKGILMERFKVDDQAAFRLLVKSSQDSNMKVTVVAQWLTDNVGTPSPRVNQTPA